MIATPSTTRTVYQEIIAAREVALGFSDDLLPPEDLPAAVAWLSGCVVRICDALAVGLPVESLEREVKMQ